MWHKIVCFESGYAMSTMIAFSGALNKIYEGKIKKEGDLFVYIKNSYPEDIKIKEEDLDKDCRKRKYEEMGQQINENTQPPIKTSFELKIPVKA